MQLAIFLENTLLRNSRSATRKDAGARHRRVPLDPLRRHRGASGPPPSPPGARARRVFPLRLVDRILVLITRLFLGNLDKLGIQVARWSSRTPREGRRFSTSTHSTGSALATSRLCRESRGIVQTIGRSLEVHSSERS
ncbi:hypothetical protein PVAP13_8NG180801 [Panicum virgatum]|uniref:Uncharacterized protein n=1 Tax=Panicum virgatum TaxID=38727 RepID=A0A8T0PD69_PANVG|nr:hypothetical protein PVAP13_8NG180801 [Panicum virgatum]KAG2557177.1 hypothetical protein PVAP13_8NG180801 [Panicum virgatum]